MLGNLTIAWIGTADANFRGIHHVLCGRPCLKGWIKRQRGKHSGLAYALTDLDICCTSLGIASVSGVHICYRYSNKEGSPSAPAGDRTAGPCSRTRLKQQRYKKIRAANTHSEGVVYVSNNDCCSFPYNTRNVTFFHLHYACVFHCSCWWIIKYSQHKLTRPVLNKRYINTE